MGIKMQPYSIDFYCVLKYTLYFDSLSSMRPLCLRSVWSQQIHFEGAIPWPVRPGLSSSVQSIAEFLWFSELYEVKGFFMVLWYSWHSWIRFVHAGSEHGNTSDPACPFSRRTAEVVRCGVAPASNGDAGWEMPIVAMLKENRGRWLEPLYFKSAMCERTEGRSTVWFWCKILHHVEILSTHAIAWQRSCLQPQRSQYALCINGNQELELFVSIRQRDFNGLI